MCQFIIENQGIQTFFVYCWKENELLDQACYDIVHDMQIPGILPTLLSEKDGKTCLKFNITSRKSLKQISSGGMKRNDFIPLLYGVIDTLMKCEEYTLDSNSILLNSQYIYINDETKEVELIYIPVLQQSNEESLENRLKQMILQLEYNSFENTEYVSGIIKYLEQQDVFSLKEFRTYISEISGDLEAEWKKIMQAGKVRMPALNLTRTKQPEPAQQNWTGPGPGREGTVPEHPKEVSEEDSLSERCTENKGMQPLKKAYIKRCRTNEKVLIDKKVFKIGTERDFVDYCVNGNPTISRNHANIVLEKDEYYIVDMNSKNHTAVNGRMLNGAEKVKLIHGSRIQLSDELFEFCL